VKVNPAPAFVNLVDPGRDKVPVENPQQPGRHVENQIVNRPPRNPSPQVAGEIGP
jgi:hypothetical protein